ncbi:hypothetical protein F4778DRAFT_315627 [Xylariomycetidae sp. FL2044]|nr:hypothetical protein F4778DRAFT_315627 [Xylariomycetidae sp. FL2044]
MRTATAFIAAVALPIAVTVNAVPFINELRKLNEQACKAAAECGHQMDCTELWTSCNLKLLGAKSASVDPNFHSELGRMIPWWYGGFQE